MTNLFGGLAQSPIRGVSNSGNSAGSWMSSNFAPAAAPPPVVAGQGMMMPDLNSPAPSQLPSSVESLRQMSQLFPAPQPAAPDWIDGEQAQGGLQNAFLNGLANKRAYDAIRAKDFSAVPQYDNASPLLTVMSAFMPKARGYLDGQISQQEKDFQSAQARALQQRQMRDSERQNQFNEDRYYTDLLQKTGSGADADKQAQRLNGYYNALAQLHNSAVNSDRQQSAYAANMARVEAMQQAAAIKEQIARLQDATRNKAIDNKAGYQSGMLDYNNRKLDQTAANQSAINSRELKRIDSQTNLGQQRINVSKDQLRERVRNNDIVNGLAGQKVEIAANAVDKNGAPKVNAATAQKYAQPLDRATAMQLLAKAGGDKEKARALARAAGYKF